MSNFNNKSCYFLMTWWFKLANLDLKGQDEADKIGWSVNYKARISVITNC